eukprot:TRINITY_DN9111_c0_g1_i2.p1 TRINITY_DN9111_c0_g1~~TRINITY_DN9111_c0_g1_i2.p1  ORF type:complete len:254 (-),score=12.22 TRINITY_DN9111_c0_g1_i2:41-802(-)
MLTVPVPIAADMDHKFDMWVYFGGRNNFAATDQIYAATVNRDVTEPTRPSIVQPTTGGSTGQSPSRMTGSSVAVPVPTLRPSSSNGSPTQSLTQSHVVTAHSGDTMSSPMPSASIVFDDKAVAGEESSVVPLIAGIAGGVVLLVVLCGCVALSVRRRSQRERSDTSGSSFSMNPTPSSSVASNEYTNGPASISTNEYGQGPGERPSTYDAAPVPTAIYNSNGLDTDEPNYMNAGRPVNYSYVEESNVDPKTSF